MVRKTKEEANATRESILQAAAHIFWEDGIASTSLEKIAQKAGVTRGAVYWHFKNKLDIVWALYEQLYIPCHEMILQDLERDHPVPLEQLQELWTNLLTSLDEDDHKRRILSIFFLRCDYSGDLAPLQKCKSQKKMENLKFFAEYFKRAKKKGHLPSHTDVNILSVSLMCYITGLVYEYLLNPDLYDLRNEGPKLVEQFFSGLKVS